MVGAKLTGGKGGIVGLLHYLLKHEQKLKRDKDGYVKFDDLKNFKKENGEYSINDRNGLLETIKRLMEKNKERNIKMFEMKEIKKVLFIKAFDKNDEAAKVSRRKRSTSRKKSSSRRKSSRKKSSRRKKSRKVSRRRRKSSRKKSTTRKKSRRPSSKCH